MKSLMITSLGRRSITEALCAPRWYRGSHMFEEGLSAEEKWGPTCKRRGGSILE